MINLKNKVVLVTGATKGIGRSIAQSFSKLGSIVIGTSTTKIGSTIISKYLGSSGKGVQLDVNKIYSVTKCIDKIKLEFGNIDILINNASIVNDKLFVNMNENEWESVVNTNLISIFRISKSVVRSMIKKKYGRIITIGSVIGTIGNIGQINYATAKAGIIGFSKSLAYELAPYNITVNVVSPGFIETDMTKKIKKKYRSNILSKIFIKRFGKPNEVASVVLFLSSEMSSYITGENIHVNGGMYI